MSDLNIFNDVIQIVWPLLAIFGLIICLKAKQRHPGQGSSLMVAGASLTTLVSVLYLVRNLGMRYDLFGYNDFSVFFSFSRIISIVGQLLFLIGLLALINSIVTSEEAPMNRL